MERVRLEDRVETVPRAIEEGVACGIPRRSETRQAADERAALEEIRGKISEFLSIRGMTAIRSRLAVDTPRVADPKIRRRNVKVVEKLASGIWIYRPPPWQVLREPLKSLFGWLRELREGRVCPLLVGAVAHHGVVVVHPFLNGNGRTARVLGSGVACNSPDTCRVNFSWAFGLRPREYYKVVRRSFLSPRNLSEWLSFLSVLVDGDERGESPVCRQGDWCSHQFASREVALGYARFLSEVEEISRAFSPDAHRRT